MTTPVELHHATILGKPVRAFLHEGRLVLVRPGETGFDLDLETADAIGAFLRDSVQRALLHGARPEGT